MLQSQKVNMIDCLFMFQNTRGTSNDVYWIASLSITGHLANGALAVTQQSAIKKTLPPP